MAQDTQNPLARLARMLKASGRQALEKLGLSQEEIDLIEVYADPVKWAATHLNWTPRDYQYEILYSGASCKQLVLRMGRRLGKTECMCILIWWHAFVQPNKGPNNQYDILIIAPYETQVDLIFKRLKQLLDQSPQLKASIKRDVHHQIELLNGSVIKGLTAGTKNSTGAANTRGQRADLIVLDEVDYMNEDDITNIINIRNEAPERIKIIAASTPSGRRGSFYRWCTGAPHNGWKEIYAPSTVNPEILKVNPDTGKTYLEELKEELTELRFLQEVMAEFGEEEVGVYAKKYIDQAVELGKRLGITYYDRPFPRRGPRILGVDWDKYKASPNIVGIELIESEGIFAPFVRVEIPKTEFSYDAAIRKIIELNAKFDPDWIVVDAGHGESQIEQLRLYGLRNPQSGLHRKVIRVHFGEKIMVRDPVTQVREKKDIKPFMVNNTVLLFERGKFAFNPHDRTMIRQFEEYRVERFGQNGKPIYSEENEHIHDCVILAIHGFVTKYNVLELFKMMNSAAILPLYSVYGDSGIGRDVDVEEPEIVPETPGPVGQTYIVGIRQSSGIRLPRRKLSGSGMPMRRAF